MDLNYLKLAGIITVFIGIVGCSVGNNAHTATDMIKERCINGVTYYIFKEYRGSKGYGFMSPKYNSEGKIELCDE